MFECHEADTILALDQQRELIELPKLTSQPKAIDREHCDGLTQISG